MSQDIYVCRDCLIENPTNHSLITQKCVALPPHDPSHMVLVHWYGNCLHQIRPVPGRDIPGHFVVCKNLDTGCQWGDECSYAHSEAEQDAWNVKKFGPGYKQKQRTQYYDPTRRSGASQYNPQQRRTSSEMSNWRARQPAMAQPQYHTGRPAPPTSYSRAPIFEPPNLAQGSSYTQPYSHPHSQHRQLQTAVHSIGGADMLISHATFDKVASDPSQKQGCSHPKSQPHPVGDQQLTPSNYKNKFRELIQSEQYSHAEILKERCNGQFELVVDFGYRGYLWGITGDKIAYVTQACEQDKGVSISHESREIKATISSVNYYHTKDVLYLDFDEGTFSSCFPAAQPGNKWEVSVKFLLKESYFRSLQRSIASLPSEIVQRLFPNPQQFIPFQLNLLDEYYGPLHLELCSEDQRYALATIISSPEAGPPILVTGPFGTGKTRILALAALYYLKHSVAMRKKVCILVCTQQHTSADTFIECLESLLVPIPEKAYVARVTDREIGYASPKYSKSLENFNEDCSCGPPSSSRPYLVVTTCQTSHKLKTILPEGFFTHILLDEGANMREPEAIAPLYFANAITKIVIAGDKQQVGPDLLVLGEQPREKGLSVSLLERLEKHYQQVGGAALHYLVQLATNYRCHGDILSLAEELFYKLAQKSGVPTDSTHPDAPFPLIFVCSSIRPPQPGENPVNELEARVVIEQMLKYAPGWPQDRWGAKLDPSQICIMSPSRSQLINVRKLLNSKGMKVAEVLKNVQRHPTYYMQGREFRALFLSTFEATHEDGSTRNPTKSIADPYIFNTVITRARSLVVSVGNPYLLLKMEEHMGRKYGEKGKCWSNYLKRCLDEDTLRFHDSEEILDAEKNKRMSQLKSAVKEHITAKYGPNESTDTFGSDSSQARDSAESCMFEEEFNIPEKYTGRLEQDFHLGHLLGKGAFAHVYKVTHKFDAGVYAIKIVNLPIEKKRCRKALREVKGLYKVTPHRNIVQYYGSWIDVSPTDDHSKYLPWKDMRETIPYSEAEDWRTDGSGSGGRSATLSESDDSLITFDRLRVTYPTAVAGIDTTAAPLQGIPCLLIRTELCRGTLEKWLDHHKTRTRSTIFNFFEQILGAVSYIHKKNLAHRDLSPSNIFFSREDDTVVKVGDFGLVTDQASRQVSFSGIYGKRLYMSPEQLESRQCTEKVDIYPLGVIYFEMNYVFSTVHEKQEVLKELQETGVPRTFKTNLPKETVVIQKMMTHDPDHRPSAEFILRSKIFHDLRNAVTKEPYHVPKM